MENLSSLEFERLLTKCASLADVRCEVVRNHDNNRWWPLYVSDWRLRMVIAGLSTRISYNMIGIYQSVVSNLNKIGYERLLLLSDVELSEILTPLGLLSSRIKFCKSIFTFIKALEQDSSDITTIHNDKLISAIEQKVYGAGYKVGQCCVLYAKGYHCGVMPVDSGMRDKLSLCLGLKVEKTPFGHEIMRKQLEELVSQIDCRAIAKSTGYDLEFPPKGPLTWWTHLVLIYYKRLYCNRPIPEQCPLRSDQSLGVQSTCLLHRADKGSSAQQAAGN